MLSTFPRLSTSLLHPFPLIDSTYTSPSPFSSSSRTPEAGTQAQVLRNQWLPQLSPPGGSAVAATLVPEPASLLGHLFAETPRSYRLTPPQRGLLTPRGTQRQAAHSPGGRPSQPTLPSLSAPPGRLPTPSPLGSSHRSRPAS